MTASRHQHVTASPSASGRDLLLVSAPLLLLVPFAGSAFRIDDPLFIWVARQIQTHPLDPYGFTLNWYGWTSAMSEVLQNPPLAAYYMAAVAAVLGWSEWALHLAFLFPAWLAVLGGYRLSQRLCSNAMLAALIATLSPVFFISSLTVMSDITMLALWLWAVNLWLDGLERDQRPLLAGSALLMGLAVLTKYFAIAMVPLLLAYSLARRRRVGGWAWFFLIPVALLALYQWRTSQLYGSGMFLNAVGYASTYGHSHGRISPMGTAVSLAFLGGCIPAALFFAGKLWTRQWLLLAALAACGFGSIIYATDALTDIANLRLTAGNLALLSAQMAVWMVAGLGLLALAAVDLYERRDAGSLLLALWVGGTFCFAGYVNWSMNGRSLLPLAAPAALLIVRHLERRCQDGRSLLQACAIPLALSALLCVLLAQADSDFAESGRAAAVRITEKYRPAERRVWFLGHWGFQLYMEQRGALALDTKAPTQFANEDVLVIPSVNSSVGSGEPPSWGTYLEFVDIPAARWVSTVGYGGGFYSDEYGPVPFAFSDVPRERFAIVGVRPELRGR